MLIDFILNGKKYRIRSSQVLVLTDDERPVAISYAVGGAIVHTDAADNDFVQTLQNLKIGERPGIVTKAT
jgi:hypothetical protein